MNKNVREMLEKQGIYIKDREVPGKTAFVFPGHGAQYVGMFEDLYENIDIIHEVFNRAEKKYMELSKTSLLDKIFARGKKAELELLKPTVMQPSIVLADVAMYEYVSELGYKPDYLLGHSLGEIAALCAAKVFSIEEAIEIAYRRAEAVEIIPPEKRGGMVSIGAEYEESLAKELLEVGGTDCEVSIINSGKQFNISGPKESIHEIKNYCEKNNITAIVLKVSHAFHSRIMEPSVDVYRKSIENFKFNKPETAVYSTILSKIYDEEMLDSKNFAGILASQLVTPFNFKDIVSKLADNHSVGYFVEAGPKDIMTKLVKKIAGDKVYAMSTNKEKQDDLQEIEIFKTKALCFGMKTVREGKNMSEERNEMGDIINIFSRETMYPTRIFKELGEPAFYYYAIAKEIEERIIASLTKKYNLSLTQEEWSKVSLKDIYEKTVVNEEKRIYITTIQTNSSVNRDEIKEYVLGIIEQNTGYPKDMLEDDLDFEADLGIDSVKQGEILSEVQDKYGYEVDEGESVKELSTINKVIDYVVKKVGNNVSSVVPADNAEMTDDTETSVKTEDVHADTSQIKEFILQVVEEQTGYPKDMLEDDLDFEADLGIDSVKQGEILSTIQDKYLYEVEEGENIKEISSISKMVEYVSGKVGSVTVSAAKTEAHDDTEPKKEVVLNDVATETVNEEEIREYILQVIEKNTGYPKDMLDSELDFEADLGIDSVKQGEILSELQEKYNYEVYEGEQVKELSNISKVLDYIVGKLGSAGTGETKSNPANENISRNQVAEKAEYTYRNEGYDSKRYVSVAMKKQMAKNPNFSLAGKNVILVADEEGTLTEALYGELRETAAKVAVISEKRISGIADSDINICDFGDRESLKNTAKSINEAHHVNVVINMSALRNVFDFGELSAEDWKKQYSAVYNSNFYVSKAVYANFEGDKENTAYFAITGIGGIYGMEKGYKGNPVGAVSAGFVKALEKELRPFKCKVIDFSTVEDVAETVSVIKDEISRIENYVEAGYDLEGRKVVEVLPKEITNTSVINEVTDDDVILVTGGGRGIIYECVNALLEYASPKIIVTGRTALPDKKSREMIMTDEEFKNYRSEFLKEQHELDPKILPVQIQRKYEKIANARLLLANLAKLEDKGYEVEYVECDAASYENMESLVTYVKKKYGKITGIINGAGLPSFGKIPKKDEVFAEKVVQVKANSSFVLMKECINEPLKFFISMGSISGRFGMDGQVDYSAAADLIVRMTMAASQLKPETRFTVMGWSAWDEVGMASDEQVKKVQQGTRGLEYLSVKEGTTHFLNEVFYGGNYPEVLIFGELGESNLPLGQMDALDKHRKNIVNNTSIDDNIVIDRIKYPMLERIVSINDKKITASKNLSIKTDVHLQDHKVEGKHVFAGVMHVETACEMLEMYLEENGLSDYKISDILNFNFYKFIKVFEGNPLELQIDGTITEQAADRIRMHVTLKSDFVNKKGMVIEKDRLHSEGDVIARKNLKANVKGGSFEKEGKELILDKYYKHAAGAITFGDTFKCIHDVKLTGSEEIVGKITVPLDGQYFAFTRNADTCISPVTIDNIGRLMLFREFTYNGYTIVPTFINKAKQYRQMVSGEELEVYCKYESRIDNDVIYSAYALDKDGNLIFDIKDMRLRRINKYNGDYSLCDTPEEYSPAV